jgi:hypothetical protein
MEAEIKIIQSNLEKDYFPSLFSNKDNTIIILASEKMSDRTFSGMIIYSINKTSKNMLGIYSDGWTYKQFQRMSRETIVQLSLKQSDL